LTTGAVAFRDKLREFGCLDDNDSCLKIRVSLVQCAGVRLGVREQDCVAVGDGGEEVSLLACLCATALVFAGWISASVEITGALVSASCHIAWTIVAPISSGRPTCGRA
jgi:hypothetical protein